MKIKAFKIIILLAAIFIIAGAALFVLIWNGVIILNEGRAGKYPVKGIDVSWYQGDIDWETLSGNNLSFVFIKATEGSTYVDDKFSYNFNEAQKTSLAVGAYHFFSYDSGGKTQAENFINTVKPYEGMLPPVIDLEFYGDKGSNPPEREYVDEQLKIMLDMLEAYYGQKPIIYATERSYRLYLSNDYEEYDIWIRNVITKPTLSDGRQWTFWQYTDREVLDGYIGDEEHIDVNVFNGSSEELEAYLKAKSYKSRGNEQ